MHETIILVGANEAECQTIRGWLQIYEIIEAKTQEETLSLLNEKHSSISLVLLDMSLRNIDSLSILKKIRENAVYRFVPVIAITDKNDEDVYEEAVSCGANAYVTKPYKERFLTDLVRNQIALCKTTGELNPLRYDKLTGLLSRESFFEEAERIIKRHEDGYYVLSCFDVENFKLINDQYGTSKGDDVLKHIADNISAIAGSAGGVSCRFSADRFAIIYPSSLLSSDEMNLFHQKTMEPPCINRAIRIRIGRYVIDDASIPVSAMYDRATLAEESIKGKYDIYIATYNDSMRNALLNEQRIINDMDRALAAGEFEPWLQPQYNHATGALIGAEALVRWRKDGKFISPAEFVPIFERNGFIYKMDQCIWDKVCKLMRRWIDEGRKPLPVSINISRRDIFHKNFVDVIKGTIEKYNLPYDLIRLEVTESAFAEAGNHIAEKIGELIKLGFTMEIDDFGSGYSSLNTLKDVPASILKLDMKFFSNTENRQRSGNIVESVVRMAKWLGMAVIAEGVEEKEQADYLKTIGCYYIQGYYYSKPLPVAEYEKLLDIKGKEPKLSRLETLKTLDNNEFWNPKSMETLIFNSYVGGACIFEFCKGKSELLRISEQYTRELGELAPNGAELKDSSLTKFIDDDVRAILVEAIYRAISEQKEVTEEVRLTDGLHTEYVRITFRVIAQADERYLLYGVIVNTTKQKLAEQKVRDTSERMSAVLENSHCGISAMSVSDDGTNEILFVNDRFFKIIGYTREQFESEIGSLFGCVHPDDYDRVVREAKNIKNIGQIATLTMRAIRRDKRIIWVRCDVSIVKFANVSGVVQLCSTLDITEQVESERKQLESAQQLEVIMSNVNGGISAIQIFDDGTSRFVFSNEKYYALYGYTREQAEAEKFDIMSSIVSEDLPELLAKVRKLKEDKKPVLIDYRITKPDGSQALLRANASIMSVKGYGDDVITSVVTDITEKKSLEEQLHAIISSINGGVSATYLRNDKLKYAIINDQYYDIIGYTKEQFESEVSSVFELIVPEERENIRKQFTAAAEHRQKYTMEYSIKCRNGKIKRILCSTSVIKLFGVDEHIQLSVSNDITELREAQRKEHVLALQLQTIMENINGGIIASLYRDNSEVEIVFANDGFYDMLGYSRESSTEMPDIRSLILNKDRNRIEQIVERIIKERGTETCEYRCRKSDGSIIWIKSANSVISLDGVGDTILLSVTTDITSEKESSEQLRFLNTSAHDILAQPDTEIAINSTLEKLLAYFAGDRTYVIEVDNVKRMTYNTYEKCAEGIESEIELLQNVPFEVSDYWFDLLNKNEFVVIDNVEALGDDKAELRTLLLQQKIHSLIVAPLMRDGVLVGFTGIDNPTKAVNQLGRLEALADYITILLTRRDLNRKIEHDNNSIKQLMNDTPGGFLRLEIRPDSNPRIESLNDGFCRMIGMSRDEVMLRYGDNALKCLNAEDYAHAKSEAEKAFSGCGMFTSRFRLLRRNEEILWVMIFGRFTKDENGKLFMNSYFTDITAQINSEKQQKKLLDNLPCGAALYEYDGENIKVIHINRRYWKLVEREPVDYSDTSVFEKIHPDDVILVHQEIESAIRQNRNISADFRIYCEKSGYRPFHVEANVTRKNDGKYLLFTSYSLISNQEMSIQHILPIALSTMMSASDDLSYVKDKDLHYICCSQSVAELFGFESTRDIIGKTDKELFSKKLADTFEQRDKEIILHSNASVGVIDNIPLPNGNICLAESSKYPIMDASGNVVGLYGISRDITMQKEKESQLELLTKTIPGGLAVYSINDSGIRILYFNEGYYNFSGCSREEYAEAIAVDPLALVFDEDKPGILRLIDDFKNCKMDGHINGCTYRCHTKGGGYRWLSLKSVLSKLSSDEFILNVVQLDITEQKEAENQQIQLLDNLPCGAGLYQFDGREIKVVHVNKRYREMVGISADAFDNESMLNYIHPDDFKIVYDLVSRQSENNYTEEPCDVRVKHTDGTYHPYRINYRFFPDSNKKWSSCVTFLPIPEEKLSMQQMMPYIFPAIMKSSTDITFAKDMHFRYLCCSNAYALLLGLESEEDVIGKTDYELFANQIADTIRINDTSLISSNEPVIDRIAVLPSKTGVPCHIRLSKYLLRDSTGSILGIYGIGRDITEHRETGDQLKLITNSLSGGLATFVYSPEENRIEYFNDGFCVLFGYTRDEFQMSIDDFIALVFEEDRVMIKEKMDLLVRDDTPIDCIYRIHLRDGSYKWLSHKAVIAERMKDSAVVNAFFMDVTKSQEEKEQLRISEELNRIAIGHSGSIITKLDVKNRTLALPDTLPKIYELPYMLYNMPEEQIELGRVSEDTADIYRDLFNSIYSGKAKGTAVYKQNSSKGWRWLKAQYTTVFSDTGKPASAVISFNDVTEKLEKEIVYNKWQQSLNERHEDSYTLFRCNLNKNTSFDSWEGKLLDVHFNEESATFDEWTAEYVKQCVFGDDCDRYLAFVNSNKMLAEYFRGHRSDVLEYREINTKGEIRWLSLTVNLLEYPNSKDIEAFLMYENIDEKKKKEILSIERSEKDSLTGILNRGAFIEKMKHALSESKSGDKHALLMLDIDNFKSVNDTLGHAAGDSALINLTKQINTSLRNYDLFGRLGGDEFLILMKNMPDRQAAEGKANRICNLKICIDNSDRTVTVSMGVAMFPDCGRDFDTLYKKVDDALYKQKKNGKNGYTFAE